MTSRTVPASETEGEHLVAVAIEVAELAADLVRKSVGKAAAAGTKSSPTDVVTATDVESESLIRRELLDRCPGSTIVGEELDDDHGKNTVGWIVDPIDGTVNFLYDLPVVSVSIAAKVGDVTVAGVVVDIIRRETFSAALGRGARRNGTLTRARDTPSLEHALIGTGFSYSSERRAQQSAILNRLLPASRDIRCMGSAALNLCWVGCGRLDGYYEHDTKLYDFAAGDIIAREGTARVELPASNGQSLSVAGSAGIFDELRSMVAR